jgi:uncharacterized SAM-dependent methyltransferase
MSSLRRVAIHSSQFPDRLRLELLDSLRARQLNHKFLYDSQRQAQKWLALHEAFSPARTDPDCEATYDRGFRATTARIRAKQVEVTGLGCGGGQKDSRLLRLLLDSGKLVHYTPTDVSVSMVLVASAAATAVDKGLCRPPLVCDLSSVEDPTPALERVAPGSAARLFAFFGMLPNFEPSVILPRLARLLESPPPPARKKRKSEQPLVLLSANLAPGVDYAAGVRRIMPLYDNELTRDWLMGFLLDLGFDKRDGRLRFSIEDGPGNEGLKRVVARFELERSRKLQVHGEELSFGAGDSIRVFYSYRHTPGLLRSLLRGHGLEVIGQWITRSGEEGVFLCRRRRIL